MGIEPTQSAWKADVLPLNYTRIWSNMAHFKFLGAGILPAHFIKRVTRFELATFTLARWHSTAELNPQLNTKQK